MLYRVLSKYRVTNEQGQNCVSARELHEGLGNKRQFTDWIKQRIAKYGFEENNDYVVINLISQNCEIKNNHGGNRKSVDYIITVDMAKELCMVENNDLGKKFRKYFIECEKKLQEVQQDFSDWIKKQLNSVDAVENTDYIKVIFKDTLSKTGQTKTDYALTIDTDMAKELCMVENNDYIWITKTLVTQRNDGQKVWI